MVQCIVQRFTQTKKKGKTDLSVPHEGNNPAQRSLTSVTGQEPVPSTWYSFWRWHRFTPPTLSPPPSLVHHAPFHRLYPSSLSPVACAHSLPHPIIHLFPPIALLAALLDDLNTSHPTITSPLFRH